ncbi:MAG: putative lipoprotein, partial [Rhodospirillales bacterium]|nr:putative lipoprotein [Rhodospirillales bacterium]
GQRAGVMGPPLRARFSQPLTLSDVARHDALSIPNDDVSYDIFTQTARLLAPDRPAMLPDPLGGLKLARILGVGVSQSANRLVTYTNAVQPLANVVDGILIGSRIGARSGAAPLAAELPLPDPVKIRDDLKVAVLVTETESDAPSHFPARTADSPRCRLWELAGTAIRINGRIPFLEPRSSVTWGEAVWAAATRRSTTCRPSTRLTPRSMRSTSG